MPRFSDSEKEKIRTRLMEKGREFFAQYGLARTAIEDLTQAAGISQGSFYAFFDSKEELLFEIVELEEGAAARELKDFLVSQELTRQRFRLFMEKYFLLMYANPVIKSMIEHRDYERIVRKLPDGKLEKHLAGELYATADVVRWLQESGSLKEVSVEALAGLFHAIFLLHLHEEEIGSDVFPQVMGLLTEMLAETLIQKE